MMTKDDALKRVIKALQNTMNSLEEKQIWYSVDLDEAINACKEALEQPALEQSAFMDEVKYGQSFMLDEKHVPLETVYKQSAQEPVAWTDEYKMYLEWDKESLCDKAVCKEHEAIALYTHPHQWQGLTDNEIDALEHNDFTCWGRDDLIVFGRAIEQALKDKKT